MSLRVTLGLRFAMLMLLCFGLLSVGYAADADASRKATKKERKAIRKAAMRDCQRTQKTIGDHGCVWRGRVRVSTVDPRYAWANVSGPSYDHSGILRRRNSRSRRWRVIHVVGGGIQPCSSWYRKAPRRVVRDLRVRGFDEASGNYDYRRC